MANFIDWAKIYCYMDGWFTWGDVANKFTIENDVAPDCIVSIPPDGTVACGATSTYSGGNSYPTTIDVTLGSSTGIVTLNFNAYSVPDKFVVVFDGQVVIDTGYRGDNTFQPHLDSALASYGNPSEPIVGIGSGSATFNKTTSSTIAQIKVYAPMVGTAWEATLSCPV